MTRTRSGPLQRSDDAPRVVRHDQDVTARLTLDDRRGTTHVQLRDLVAGHGEPVTVAGRYLLDRCLGRGGMAAVFGGRVLSVGCSVALKILDDERGHQDDGFSRFLAEARILGKLRHPNIVEVYDCGSTGEGLIYMVMELLEGEDLRSLLRREGALPVDQVKALMADICAGLEAVHAHDLVHRDLKPANCFLTPKGLKLLDFGIASPVHAEATLDGWSASDRPVGERMTQGGKIIGTPEYMSPEQACGEVVDPRSDVYSAGILLGQLLTGRAPFESKSRVAVIDAQINEAPPTLAELAEISGIRNPQLAVFESVYARALSKDPAERYASIKDFAEAVANAGKRWWQQPRKLFGAVAGVAAALL